MRKHIQYLWYVIRHKWFVFIECCHLGVPWRGIVHDMSKFLPSEWFPYTKMFYGEYGYLSAPNKEHPDDGYNSAMNAIANTMFEFAWLKHIHRNKHHWQYWILTQDDDETRNMQMPDKYAKEMLADWRGAGRAIHGKDDTREWYLKRRERMKRRLHPYTRLWIERELLIWGEMPLTSWEEAKNEKERLQQNHKRDS